MGRYKMIKTSQLRDGDRSISMPTGEFLGAYDDPYCMKVPSHLTGKKLEQEKQNIIDFIYRKQREMREES